MRTPLPAVQSGVPALRSPQGEAGCPYRPKAVSCQAVTVTSGGTLAPGTSVGTLTIKTASFMGGFKIDLFDFTTKGSSPFGGISDPSGNYQPAHLSMDHDTGVLTAIPEPGSTGVLGLGALAVLRLRRPRRR